MNRHHGYSGMGTTKDDGRLPCCFCGSTRSVKRYTRDGSEVECANTMNCLRRQDSGWTPNR